MAIQDMNIRTTYANRRGSNQNLTSGGRRYWSVFFQTEVISPFPNELPQARPLFIKIWMYRKPWPMALNQKYSKAPCVATPIAILNIN
jgi:hypothetical protein